jgi:hypothetical protein
MGGIMNALIGFCLDESGSMKADITRDAFNTFLRMQQYRIDDCHLYLVKFSYNYSPTVDFESIFKVPEMSTPGSGSFEDGGDGYATSLHYAPAGGTLLYDSMAYTIKAMEDKIQSLPEAERPRQVTLVVQTDGGNSQSKTSPDQLARANEKLRAKGWDLIFLADGNDGQGTSSTAARRCGYKPNEILVYTDPIKAFEEASDRILESVVTGKLGAPRAKQ